MIKLFTLKIRPRNDLFVYFDALKYGLLSWFITGMAHTIICTGLAWIFLGVMLRLRSRINSHFQGSRRSHGKARGGRIACYLTDEQRSAMRDGSAHQNVKLFLSEPLTYVIDAMARIRREKSSSIKRS